MAETESASFGYLRGVVNGRYSAFVGVMEFLSPSLSQQRMIDCFIRTDYGNSAPRTFLP